MSELQDKTRKENLAKGKSFDKYSEEELKEVTSNGGKQKGINFKKKKTFAECFEFMLDQKPNKEVIRKIKANFPPLADLDENDLTNRLAMFSGVYAQALKGNPKAFEVIRDTIGERPVEKIQQLKPATINVENNEDKDALLNVKPRATTIPK